MSLPTSPDPEGPASSNEPEGPAQTPAPLPNAETAERAGLIRGQTSAHRGLRTFAQDRSRSRREP
ncbi:hypothetical protein HX870_21350 [Pseudomonas gingeri]|uniref:hypothetical protein n=1 Tax=Pseudomonas gingeri TaxID=117681 RepID=UPI0015A16E2C|nr:hypothetical protein [Pseudomonas gingeri]NWD70151.1 hypothetical protein [Pseudomonas gingeri]